MTRPFKFRVWDKLAERMIYSGEGYQAHYILDLNGQFHNLQNGSGGDDYIVQQFTGIYDRNSDPIYEGDIIRGQFDFGPAGVVTQTLPVSWDLERGYQWDYWYLSTIERVGNIFQHKHLLKK